MKFTSEKRMKNREVFVNIYPDLKTKKDGLFLVDVQLNSQYLFADENYEELSVFKRPYKENLRIVKYTYEALYTNSEIESIKDVAEDNYFEVFDNNGNFISVIYALKADLVYSKISNINYVKLDMRTIKKSNNKIDESSLYMQYNYNVNNDQLEVNTDVLDKMLDYDLTFKQLQSFDS